MILMEREREVVHSHRLRISLASLLIIVGFTSIVLYLGSTILYPLLQFDEFVGQALHGNMQKVLADRYVGYLPLVLFGVITVIVGNWLWFSKKDVDNGGFAMTLFAFLTIFVIIMLRKFA